MTPLSVLKDIRLQYPTPLGSKHAQFLNQVCLALGAKMFKKDTGDHTTLPNGVNISLDILIFDNQWVDVLGDAEGAAVPSWNPNPNPTGVFVDPLPMSAFGAVDPPPPPPPIDLSAVLTLLNRISNDLAALRLDVINLESTIAPPINVKDLTDRVSVVQAQLQKGFEGKGRLLGQPVTFQILPKP